MTERLPQFHLSLLSKELVPTQSVKDLGVPFGKNLTFNNHVVNTVSSCMSVLGQINYLKHVFKEDLRMTIINASVFSKLYYCSSVWSNTSDTNITKLQSVQNFAARIVSNTKKYDHVTPVLKRLRWLPVKTNLYLRNTVMAFKCTTSMASEYLGNKFTFRGNVSRRVTRSWQQLNIPLFKTETGQRSLSYRIVDIWNNLPSEIKLSQCLNSFKCNLRKYLLEDFLR